MGRQPGQKPFGRGAAGARGLLDAVDVAIDECLEVLALEPLPRQRGIDGAERIDRVRHAVRRRLLVEIADALHQHHQRRLSVGEPEQLEGVFRPRLGRRPQRPCEREQGQRERGQDEGACPLLLCASTGRGASGGLMSLTAYGSIQCSPCRAGGGDVSCPTARWSCTVLARP